MQPSRRSAIRWTGPHLVDRTQCRQPMASVQVGIHDETPASDRAAQRQKALRHSSITVTTGIYLEVIEAVKRDALDSMDTLFDPSDDTAI